MPTETTLKNTILIDGDEFNEIINNILYQSTSTDIKMSRGYNSGEYENFKKMTNKWMSLFALQNISDQLSGKNRISFILSDKTFNPQQINREKVKEAIFYGLSYAILISAPSPLSTKNTNNDYIDSYFFELSLKDMKKLTIEEKFKLSIMSLFLTYNPFSKNYRTNYYIKMKPGNKEDDYIPKSPIEVDNYKKEVQKINAQNENDLIASDKSSFLVYDLFRKERKLIEYRLKKCEVILKKYNIIFRSYIIEFNEPVKNMLKENLPIKTKYFEKEYILVESTIEGHSTDFNKPLN